MLEVGESTALLNPDKFRVVGARREGTGEWMEEADGARQEQENTFSFFSFFGCSVISVPQPGIKARPPQ